MKVVSKSPKETEHFADKFGEWVLEHVKGRTSGMATVIGLYGNLGSGKTAFTQALARYAGIEDTVTSPTFVIEKIYRILPSLSTVKSPFSGTFTHLIHIDAYRLENSDELRHLGWEKIIKDSRNLIVIEWPERIIDLLPADHVRLKFTFVDETTREIEEMVQ